MNRYPYEPEYDSNVEIVNEEIREFNFPDFVVYYNVTQGMWYADYYLEGDAITEPILDRDSIPEGIELTPEEFDLLQETVKE